MDVFFKNNIFLLTIFISFFKKTFVEVSEGFQLNSSKTNLLPEALTSNMTRHRATINQNIFCKLHNFITFQYCLCLLSASGNLLLLCFAT